MHINVINTTDTCAMLGLGGALAYVHGRDAALVAITSFVVAKIIGYVQQKEIFTASQATENSLQDTIGRLDQKGQEQAAIIAKQTSELAEASIFMREIETSKAVADAQTRVRLQSLNLKQKGRIDALEKNLHYLQRSFNNKDVEIRSLKQALIALKRKHDKTITQLAHVREELSDIKSNRSF